MKRDSTKSVKLLGVIAACLLLTSAFTVIPALSAQPPIDKSTYYVATAGQPSRLDPMRAYDTASGELIQNVYEQLIRYGDKHSITFTPGVGHNLTAAEQSDLSVYVPVIATEVPSDTNGGIIRNFTGVGDELWTFTINTNAQFPMWIAANGTEIPAHNVTVDDVVYSFQRQMVYDSPNAPTWMWYQTAFFADANWWDGWDDYFGNDASYSNGTFKYTANETTAGDLISSWVYTSENATGPTVFFHFMYPYSDATMYQIFAQSWGSILEKAWVVEHGGWNGTFYPGWSNDCRRKPTITRSELDYYKNPAIYGAAGSKYPGVTGSNHVPDMLGTGPYMYTSWDTTTKTWRIDYNPNYWCGWGNAGDKAGNYVQTVIERGIDTWPTRKMLFLNGDFDAAVVPNANMHDLLQTGSNYDPIAGVNVAYNLPTLSNDVLLFVMNVSAMSAYQSYVGYPSHLTAAEPYFFNNTHLRRAFAWALNYTQYIQQAYSGDGLQQASWWVDGLLPADAKNTSIPLRNLDLNQMKSELDQAIVDGYNVSQVGFETTLVYNTGNNGRMIAMNLIASAFASLGSKYHCNVVGLDYPTYIDGWSWMELPVYAMGWLADFADPDDFAEPYMHSEGSFLIMQGPPFPQDQPTIDAKIDAARHETNVTQRALDYQDLEYAYWLDCIGIPLYQPVGRRWARDWVKGWYYNALYQASASTGLYAYDLYKSAPTYYLPVDVGVTAITPVAAYPTTYISMGQMNQMYGGGAPARMTFQVHIKRNDANTNVTSLTLAVSLERFNLTNLSGAVPTVNPSSPAYLATTIVLLAPGEEWTGILTWYEDGKVSTCQANATWEIAAYVAIVAPTTAEDNNTANDFADSGFSSTALTLWNATRSAYYLMLGDTNGDAIVNILDAKVFMNSFGKSYGQPGYNQAADLNGDGVIDIFDAILFANNFGKKAAFSFP